MVQTRRHRDGRRGLGRDGDIRWTLPGSWADTWTVALASSPEVEDGTEVAAGDDLYVPARSVVVLITPRD
jgi:hypothetical protein